MATKSVQTAGETPAGDPKHAARATRSAGRQMRSRLLDVASGRKKTWAEHWKLHNALVLFNPAPVT